MGYVIVEYGISIIDTAIHMFFLETMLGLRERKKKNRYIFAVIYFLIAQYLMAYLIPQMVCIILVEVLFCVLSLKGERYEHIIWPIFLNVTYCAISSIVLPVLSITTGKIALELATAGSVERIWAMLIQKFFICAILWIILSYKGKWLNLAPIEKTVVIVMIIANLFIVYGFYVISVSTSMEVKAQNELFVISVLIVIVLITCAVLVVKISSKNKQVLETHMLKFQLESQVDMIESMRKNNEEVRVLRHDLKHYAVIVRDMVEVDNKEGALTQLEKYIEKTVQAEQKTDYIKGNPSINAVIYNCVSQCDDRNIRCNTKISTSYSEHMEQDIAIVFANLLDNAIRAEECVNEDKRSIDIKVRKEGDIIKAVVNNYIEKSVLDENPELETSKEDKNIHGWGMKSVRNIIEKYNGGIEISDDNNIFSIIFKIPTI